MNKTESEGVRVSSRRDSDGSSKSLIRRNVARSSVKDFFLSQLNELSKINLDRLARHHLGQNRRQLVVSSFDYVSTAINLSGVYEKEDLDLLFEWLQGYSSIFKESTALDVGANVGNHSLYFSDIFRAVHSFEPSLRTYKILKLNSELADNVSCYNIGLSDATSQAQLNVDKANLGASSVSRSDGSGVSVTVDLIKLDDFSGAAGRISFVKIDVEGLEFQVLSGAKKTIQEHRPIIIFEQVAQDMVNGTSACIDLLKGFGYKNFAAIEHSPKPIKLLPWYLQDVLQQFRSLFFEGRREVVMHRVFEKRNYAFVVAIPDWVSIEP